MNMISKAFVRMVIGAGTVLLAIGTANAADGVGVVTSLEGVVDVLRASGEPELLKEHDQIFTGDRIRTKRYSKAEVSFRDSSVVKLAPETCVTVDAYTFSDGGKREEARLKLSRGKVEAIVSKTARADSFHIDTPNAAGAVKGSDVFVFYQGGTTGVLVKEGLMSVANLALPDARIDVRKGDSSMVSFGDAPNKARAYLDAEMKVHSKDVRRALAKKWVQAKGGAQMTAFLASAAGEVRIFKKGTSDWRAAMPGETVAEGDTVQTGDDGVAQLRLSNGNMIFLSSSTEMAITKLAYDPGTGDFDNAFETKSGKIKAVVERMGKGSTFEVKTPMAVCGVRGTVMFLDVALAATEAFYEGGGGIMTSTISGASQTLEPGQNSTADAGGISVPVTTSDDQKVALDQSFSAQDMTGGYSAPASADAAGGGVPEGGDAAAGLGADEAADAIDSTVMADAPTFDEVANVNQPANDVTVFYDAPSMSNLPSPPAGIISANVDLHMYSDFSWTATITGTYNGAPALGSDMTVNNGTDFFDIIDIDAPDLAETWTATSGGSINGAPSINDQVLETGSISGGRDPGNTGNYWATATGKWHDDV